MGTQAPPETGDLAQTKEDVADQAALILRAKNIKEYHSILTTAGDLTFPNGVAIESGVVATFQNKGLFDGNWIIQKVTIHLVDGKLQTEIEWRKCLDFSQAQVENVPYVTQESGEDGGD